ncbi:hypothetical protein RDI58_008632 [Solanum bulbocastanum]|uniref:Uncharacterized protein n=1 Tax=Solanum bulbocastanum TaxID=147425 RepID=A0AAN8TXK3_SOLBU
MYSERPLKDDSERIPLTLLPEEDDEVEGELTYGTTNFPGRFSCWQNGGNQGIRGRNFFSRC